MMKNVMKKCGKLCLISFFLLVLNQSNLQAQTKNDDDKVYVKIEVKGMACAYCAFGMEKELKKVSGVDHVNIQLEDGMAYISTPKDQEPDKNILSLVIKNAGFTPGTIEFSDIPFEKAPKIKK